jgi:hypothetical protein
MNVNTAQVAADNTPTGADAAVQQATPQQTLFMNGAAAEQARAQLIAKVVEESSKKKAPLPDIVPGFKASPLSLGEFVALTLLPYIRFARVNYKNPFGQGSRTPTPRRFPFGALICPCFRRAKAHIWQSWRLLLLELEALLRRN